ncbi:hypothetical protein ScPMuIL_013394 [Solemya velum]
MVTTIGFVSPAAVTEEHCPAELLKTNQTETNLTDTGQKEKAQRDDDSTGRTKRSQTESLEYNMETYQTHFSEKVSEEKLLEERGWMFDAAELYHLFSTILILVVLGELLMSPAGALADSGCMETLGTENMSKYGNQRAWSSIGYGVMVAAVGAVLNSTRKKWTVCGLTVFFTNYRVAFLFFAGNTIMCFVSTIFFKFESRKHVGDEGKPNPLLVIRMFLTAHYGSWLVCIFFMGICNGVIIGFLYWHLENMGATQFLIGTVSCVGNISEILTFFMIFGLIRRVGHVNIIFFGLFGYIVRFCAFAAIDNPWLVVPFEILQGFTYAAVWVVVSTYLCMSIPNEYLATVQGVLHGVYWGLGCGTGHMLSGLLVEQFGAVNTFWAFAVASAANLVIFALVQKVFEKPVVFGNYEIYDE